MNNLKSKNPSSKIDIIPPHVLAGAEQSDSMNTFEFLLSAFK
jgi:hypothetical protein